MENGIGYVELLRRRRGDFERLHSGNHSAPRAFCSDAHTVDARVAPPQTCPTAWVDHGLASAAPQKTSARVDRPTAFKPATAGPPSERPCSRPHEHAAIVAELNSRRRSSTGIAANGVNRSALAALQRAKQAKAAANSTKENTSNKAIQKDCPAPADSQTCDRPPREPLRTATVRCASTQTETRALRPGAGCASCQSKQQQLSATLLELQRSDEDARRMRELLESQLSEARQQVLRLEQIVLRRQLPGWEPLSIASGTDPADPTWRRPQSERLGPNEALAAMAAIGHVDAGRARLCTGSRGAAADEGSRHAAVLRFTEDAGNGAGGDGKRFGETGDDACARRHTRGCDRGVSGDRVDVSAISARRDERKSAVAQLENRFANACVRNMQDEHAGQCEEQRGACCSTGERLPAGIGADSCCGGSAGAEPGSGEAQQPAGYPAIAPGSTSTALSHAAAETMHTRMHVSDAASTRKPAEQSEDAVLHQAPGAGRACQANAHQADAHQHCGVRARRVCLYPPPQRLCAWGTSPDTVAAAAAATAQSNACLPFEATSRESSWMRGSLPQRMPDASQELVPLPSPSPETTHKRHCHRDDDDGRRVQGGGDEGLHRHFQDLDFSSSAVELSGLAVLQGQEELFNTAQLLRSSRPKESFASRQLVMNAEATLRMASPMLLKPYDHGADFGR